MDYAKTQMTQLMNAYKNKESLVTVGDILSNIIDDSIKDMTQKLGLCINDQSGTCHIIKTMCNASFWSL